MPTLPRPACTGSLTTPSPARRGPRQELRKISSRGWALVDQELEEGVRSIAAPIRDGDGKAIAAVNISTHAGRRTLEGIVADLLDPLLKTAGRIERDLASSHSSARSRTGI